MGGLSRGESMSIRIRALGPVAAVALLGSGLLTMSSAGAATPQSVPVLLSQNRPVSASASGPGPQWIVVDLGAVAQVSRVHLEWDASCATGYRIETSVDQTTWTAVF